MEYGQQCKVMLGDLPRVGVYAGYDIHAGKHVILIQNPSDERDIIPLRVDELEIGKRLTINKALSESELEFAKKSFGELLK